jgi:hypothetical protein
MRTAEELHEVADSLRREAAHLVDAFVATELLGNEAVWRGPHAERYRAEWRSARDLLEHAAMDLRAAAAEVDRHASEAARCQALADFGGLVGELVLAVTPGCDAHG